MTALDVADSLTRARAGLVDASVVADRLGVSRGWVYEHADELGALRLGSGPRARLRFDLERAVAALTACSSCRTSEAAENAPVKASPRRRSRTSGTNVELLPILGSRFGSEAA